MTELKDRDGLTQADLAERAGVTAQALTNWANGHREPRSVEDWVRLAKALEVRPAWLLFGEGSPDQEADALSRQIQAMPAESRRALHVLLNRTA